MAQGTSDKRFLTNFAKTASVGVILALAVAAFPLSGCGGGSSESSSSTVAASGSRTSDSGAAAATAPGGPSAPGGAGGNGAESASGGPGGSGGGRSSEGKHGPPVPQPKGEREPGITPQQRREATVADLTLQSPSSEAPAGGPRTLSAQYTCDGKSTSPALRWRGVPAGTAELVLFAMNVRPVEGRLFFDWAVAGLGPDLEEIEAGKLPAGAVVGRNSFGKTGYEICPAGSGETYVFTLFALPKKLSPKQGFEPLALRQSVLDTSGDVGLLALSYARG